jgi:hypothetical protein
MQLKMKNTKMKSFSELYEDAVVNEMFDMLFMGDDLENEPEEFSSPLYEYEYAEEMMNTLLCLHDMDLIEYMRRDEKVSDIESAVETLKTASDELANVLRTYIRQNHVKLSPDSELIFWEGYIASLDHELTMEEKQVLWTRVDAA